MNNAESSLLTIDVKVPERLRAAPGTAGRSKTDSIDSRLVFIDADQVAPVKEPFAFKLVLDQSEIDEARADQLYARCKDGALVTSLGVSFVDFDRRADSLEDAIRSAIADVQAAGFRVSHVEIEADGLTPQPA